MKFMRIYFIRVYYILKTKNRIHKRYYLQIYICVYMNMYIYMYVCTYIQINKFTNIL